MVWSLCTAPYLPIANRKTHAKKYHNIDLVANNGCPVLLLSQGIVLAFLKGAHFSTFYIFFLYLPLATAATAKRPMAECSSRGQRTFAFTYQPHSPSCTCTHGECVCRNCDVLLLLRCSGPLLLYLFALLRLDVLLLFIYLKVTFLLATKRSVTKYSMFVCQTQWMKSDGR